MNKEIIQQAAEAYGEKSFIWPLNSEGDLASIPVGQTVPHGYRKHCKIAEKHFKAGVLWHEEQTAIYKEANHKPSLLPGDFVIPFGKWRAELKRWFSNRKEVEAHES
jgi:hypothetical protein